MENGLTHAEIIGNATIIDEGIKVCPLCSSKLMFFFINFNEKVLMCEDIKCVYPFGYDDLKFVKEDDELGSDEDVPSLIRRPTDEVPIASGSGLPAADWPNTAKIDEVNKNKSPEVPETRKQFNYKEKLTGNSRKTDVDDQILKRVEAIRKIQEKIHVETQSCIMSDKWYKNLMNKQEAAIMNPHEVNKFKKRKPDIGLGELKIDINRVSEQNSIIKIEIANVASN